MLSVKLDVTIMPRNVAAKPLLDGPHQHPAGHLAPVGRLVPVPSVLVGRPVLVVPLLADLPAAGLGVAVGRLSERWAAQPT